MHDVLSVSLTVATILAAAFMNQSSLNSLRSDMERRFSEVNGRLDSIQRDMREFYAEHARHDTRIAALERAADRS